MVRETRHLWVGNLPDNIREERIRELFKRYGRVQSVKLLPRVADQEKAGEITMACTVAFMDIKSASKAHNAELKIDDRTLNTEYYEPAAIPSAASPQSTTSPYSTSPGANRFPNGHGTTEEHAAFQERFYAPPGGGGGGDADGGRRQSAPSSRDRDRDRERDRDKDRDRGRDRDRSYRSGGAAYDRHGRPAGGGGGAATPAAAAGAASGATPWPYESPRYNSTVAGTQSETGYNSTPSDTNERKSSEHSGRKKTKSRSGSRSPSPSGSISSRSPSRSRSRSSSSSSSSSTSRATSSTGSPKSRRQASSGAAAAAAAAAQGGQEDRRPLAICVKNLPLRSSDTSLKDGLFHEYKKHGKVTWVKVVGQSADRHAVVCFKKPEDVEKALEVSQDKLFFGCKIEVAPYYVCDIDDGDLRPYEAEIDEYNPKATRTLFIGNLEKDVTASDLRKHFDQFGEIIEIDIKKQGAVSSYAFCQYSDIVSVVKAIRKMDGEHLGNNRIKLGFGKSMPYNCVWIDGINENVNEKYLRMQFEPFGVINRCIIDREKGQALIFYEQVLHAQQAVVKMRGFVLKNSKLQVDFASRECQECFFERLEKQGTVLDRTLFEDRRDSSTRSFESSAAARFSSRYDTPTRPRTSSYSSRTSTAPSQATTAIPSPGTPGSMTPRGGGSRSRLARFAYEYDPADYAERHFRSYDEYSQGSAASHEDPYDHEYAYAHDSPTHLDPLEVRVIQNIDAIPFAPPDIRNLQKERVHLLEQLEECPSSGDELISPKKRLKLDLLDPSITSDVIIEANRDHRKVVEVRRLSDVGLRHHSSSRRPSVDSLKYKEVVNSSGHDRSGAGGYLPHSVGCKRRKTAGSSDGGSRSHHYDHSGPESVGGSRPGTPLCDEKPENFQPSEPRRAPREREGPLTLPLPRFAAQVMRTGSVSVAGIKGQKETSGVLSSPPAAATSPRISNPKPPSPVHVPPPASPPPRPPSLSSNSSDGDVTPPSPSLEERIRSLDEKYEKWSGSRALSAASGEVLATLDANLERFKIGHKLLNLNLKELQPSEIVKSVMAKRSVFDEDSKRLENVGEKYEPKEYSLFPRTSSLCALGSTTVQSALPASPLSAPPTLKLAPVVQSPKTPTMLSPRSSGTSIPAAKGLQYPFPSHPPIQMTATLASVSTTTTATTQVSLLAPSPSPLPSSTTSNTVKSATHCENRLKPCPSAPSDSRTSSKINLNANRTAALQKCEKTNIPNSSEPVNDRKAKDKCEKVSGRRDSSSSSSSPRAAVGSRRNSDSTTRRIEDSEKYASESSERSKSEEHKKDSAAEKTRLENEKIEKEKAEKERLERLEQERLEKERQERENEERQRLEKEKLERERLEKEKAEREKREREKAEKERAEKLRLEKEKAEKAKLEREKAEKERLEKERQEKERQERREREERERREKEERERVEREREVMREKELLEKQEKERKEQERKEREDKERKEREKERHDDADEKGKHREDNQEKKKDDHKHRDSHSEIRHRENNLDKHVHDKSTKEEKSSSHDSHKKDSHDSRSHDRSRHHSDRDSERRKESIKENRDNNIFDKQKSLNDGGKDSRAIVETRHMSIDLEKTKSFDSKHEANKRKERNNSLPANIGNKRRISSHESLDSSDETKRIKLSHDHKKISERRDSKDSSRSEDRSKNGKHKNNSVKSLDKYNSRDEEKRKEKEREERHKKHKLDKQKSKSKSREKEPHESLPTPITNSNDFLAKLNLKSNEEIEKQAKEKESKEKRKDSHYNEEKRDDKRSEDRLKRDKVISMETKEVSKDKDASKTSDDKKKRDRIRKTLNTSDSDSDEPKKHSIFDIVDDEPAYISMYDKVKARSCKNMQKQEEEKRQEKIKAKFSQLKQSRARREEKKRSTSWDEDSDSDKEGSEMKFRRCPKHIIDSSDESQDRKVHRKRDLNTDSDCSLMKQQKFEQAETSEDDFKNKHQTFKGCKSRITSDTSDDEYKSKVVNNTDIFHDTEEEHIGKNEKVTSVKNELERLIKKERRNSKYQETMEENTMHELISEAESLEPKHEKFNDRQIFENTTDDEAAEMKKERSERREKKHKKKQKKQKHILSGEEPVRMEPDTNQEDSEKNKHHEKKKDHVKKDKKKDKNKEGRDKSKKSKKNKVDSKNEKREGKIETIFGSLSEDSEAGAREVVPPPEKPIQDDENAQQATAYNSESDKETEIMMAQAREEHKKRKEKKRREKERRLLEAAAAANADEEPQSNNSNDNSMDYADMGKQLEANIKDDDSLEVKTEVNSTANDAEEGYNYVSHDHLKKDKEDRKDSREKKKKRKKNKEEKGKHHHHHHHHDKTKAKSPELRKEGTKVDIKVEPEEESACHTPVSQSLPSIFEPSESKSSPDINISPSTRETVPVISPIPKTPTSAKEKKREQKLIPGFGTEIDEKLHESAIKSISEFEPVVKKEEIKEEIKEEKSPEMPEEKPRVVISQEETEDAVAALLGESFGREQFDECYTEDINTATDQVPNLTEENNVQDDEEMRQAVQSLSAADLDVKPETPQSETDLQIDTDTEEQEEVNVPFLPPNKPQNTPEFPQAAKQESCEEKVINPPPVYNKSSIGSPPSLTPIVKAQQNPPIETIKPEESAKSLPILPEQKQSVSQTWPVQTTIDTSAKIEKNAISEVVTTPVATSVVIQSSAISATTTKPFTSIAAPTIIKVDSKYPPLSELPKQTIVEQKIPVLPLQVSSSGNTLHLHNLPARSPIQATKQPLEANLIPVKPANLNINRLPITSVMVSKPLQATTMILPQAKVAHPLEPPKLVSTADTRPKMVIQTTSIQPSQYTQLIQGQPRMMIRHVPPPGLLIPSRNLPPNAYGAYVGNVHSTTYSFPTIVKDNPHIEPTLKTLHLPTSGVGTNLNLHPKPSIVPTLNMQQPASPKPIVSSVLSPNTSQASLIIISKPPVLVTASQPTVISSNISSPKQVLQPQSPKVFVTQTPSPKPTPPPLSPSQKLNAPVETPVINCAPPVVKESAVVEPAPEKPVENITKQPEEIKQESKVASTVNVVAKDVPEIKKEEPVKPASPRKLAIEKVTDELNLSLEKQADVKEESKVEENKPEVEKSEAEPSLPTKEERPLKEDVKKEEATAKSDSDKTESDSSSLAKDIEKFDEEKADTESIVSDISKERSTSADLLTKEDPLGPQEDSDYWSAKEVNIDSVIKTLCSADELSDHSSETGKDDWGDEERVSERDRESPEKKSEASIEPKTDESSIMDDEGVEHEEQKVETPTTTRSSARGRGRGGRGRGRGRGGTVSVERVGMQTRRGKLTREQSAPPATITKRGRGGRPRSERKSSKESDSAPNDVYEFRDDSDDSNKEQRPRLVLTIKSSAASNTSNSHTTAIVKEITKDGAKEIGKETSAQKEPPKPTTESKEEFASPQTNTRKSKRLQEKDISKTSVDDTIEDVVKNTIQTRASANQRRSTRQLVNKQSTTAQQDTPRKSPRGRKPRHTSEPAENSSSEENLKEETPKPIEKETTAPPTAPVQTKESEKPKEPEKEIPKPAVSSKEKPYEGLKAAMLRRIKGEMNAGNHEPTNLIDPVTGLLTPMRECEEGRYIPLPGTTTGEQNITKVPPPTTTIAKVDPIIKATVPELPKTQPTVIAQPQQSTIIQQQPAQPQSLKAHVLSSQAAKAVVTQVNPVVPPKPVGLVTPQQTPVLQPTQPVVSKPMIPITSILEPAVTHPVHVITSATVSVTSHLSPRPNIGISVNTKPQVKPPMISPQSILLPNQQKQYLPVTKQQPIPKAHMSSVIGQPQLINTPVPYGKLPSNLVNIIHLTKGAMKQQKQQIFPGQVASPPLTKAQAISGAAGRVIQVPASAVTKGVMEPPNVDVNLTNVVLGRPTLSPKGPQPRVGAPHPVGGYEPSLGEAISHFPSGPLRPPPDLNPAHYMHPSHLLQYQQFLRQQRLPHLQRPGLEKTGEEGEEAPVTSPPLELRRPGSVGLGVRATTVVPHSLHSPHDRATESPQIAQVYNSLPHSSRLPPYHSGRYFDQTEPPPAHRPLTSHASLTGLGAHMSPMGAADRPAAHLPPDRPIGGHLPSAAHMGPTERITGHIERPLTSHVIGTGLGAAGNLMGAVAKHVGAEAPATQRGLQAATPPHASQVPPQAESLFMLLKQYPLMWQGLLALKNDQSAVQMYFVSGNNDVAKCSLPKNSDGTTPPLRIFQRMRLEPLQVEGVARKMQMQNEHCMLLALPCGHDPMDVLKQSTNLTNGFITYLQQKQAAGIINVAAPGTTQPPAYVVHIFPSCDFVNENLRRISPCLLERVADIPHLLIVITTV